MGRLLLVWTPNDFQCSLHQDHPMPPWWLTQFSRQTLSLAWPDHFILLPSSAPWRCPGSSTSSSSLGLPSPASLGSESYAQQLHFIFCGYAQAFYTTLTHGQGRGCMAHIVQLMASSCSRATVAFREGSAQDLGGFVLSLGFIFNVDCLSDFFWRA